MESVIAVIISKRMRSNRVELYLRVFSFLMAARIFNINTPFLIWSNIFIKMRQLFRIHHDINV